MPAEDASDAPGKMPSLQPMDKRSPGPQVSISVGAIKRPGPPLGRSTEPVVRSDSGKWVDDHLVEIIALGIAGGAFWQPGTFLVFVVVACLGIGAVRSAAADGRITGADLVAVPARGLKRALGLLAPEALIKGAFLASVILGLSVAVPGALSALLWLLAHGSEGAQLAARLGARAHAVQFAVAEVCFLAVRGIGSRRAGRTAELKRRTERMTEGGVSILAVGVLLAGLVVATVPEGGGGMFAGADGLGWVVSSLREPVDRLRDSVVTSEVDGLSTCLSNELSATWSGLHTVGNRLEDRDIARFGADHDPSPEESILVALAAHNQLAPWVEQIDVTGPNDALLLSVDRRTLRTDVPVTSVKALGSAVVVGEALLATPSEAVNRSSLLKCSISVIQ